MKPNEIPGIKEVLEIVERNKEGLSAAVAGELLDFNKFVELLGGEENLKVFMHYLFSLKDEWTPIIGDIPGTTINDLVLPELENIRDLDLNGRSVLVTSLEAGNPEWGRAFQKERQAIENSPEEELTKNNSMMHIENAVKVVNELSPSETGYNESEIQQIKDVLNQTKTILFVKTNDFANFKKFYEARDFHTIAGSVEDGIKKDDPNEWSYFMLMAAREGNVEFLKGMLDAIKENDKDISNTNSFIPAKSLNADGDTLVYFAVDKNKDKVLETLLSSKACGERIINQCGGREGLSPLALALEKGDGVAAKMLKSKGAKVLMNGKPLLYKLTLDTAEERRKYDTLIKEVLSDPQLRDNAIKQAYEEAKKNNVDLVKFTFGFGYLLTEAIAKGTGESYLKSLNTVHEIMLDSESGLTLNKLEQEVREHKKYSEAKESIFVEALGRGDIKLVSSVMSCSNMDLGEMEIKGEPVLLYAANKLASDKARAMVPVIIQKDPKSFISAVNHAVNLEEKEKNAGSKALVPVLTIVAETPGCAEKLTSSIAKIAGEQSKEYFKKVEDALNIAKKDHRERFSIATRVTGFVADVILKKSPSLSKKLTDKLKETAKVHETSKNINIMRQNVRAVAKKQQKGMGTAPAA